MARTSKKDPREGLWGDAIREEVAQRGESLERVSTELGLIGNTLSRWSNGIEPKAQHYPVLMEFLNVDQDELGALIIEDQIRRWGVGVCRRCSNAAAAEAGVPKIHFHQLRHTFSHQWLKDGGSGEDLMRLAGWSSRAMLTRYGSALADERARDAYRQRLPGERR